MLKGIVNKNVGAKIAPLSLFFVLLLVTTVSAGSGQIEKNLELRLHEISLTIILTNIALITLITVFILSSKKKLKGNSKKTRNLKIALFSAITISVLLTSFFVSVSTIYLNAVSETKGPVHWHADYEVWNCDKKLDLINPRGLVNRVGTSTFHEHNDDRIHVEGVVVKKREVNLKSYVSVVGGSLQKGRLLYPTEERRYGKEKFEVMEDGNLCNGQPAKLQMWLYRVENPDDVNKWIYTVTKIEDYENYVLGPETIVPAGDCFILEFAPEKETTDRICETYKVKEERGELLGR